MYFQTILKISSNSNTGKLSEARPRNLITLYERSPLPLEKFNCTLFSVSKYQIEGFQIFHFFRKYAIALWKLYLEECYEKWLSI